jgi:hypothetical protein
VLNQLCHLKQPHEQPFAQAVLNQLGHLKQPHEQPLVLKQPHQPSVPNQYSQVLNQLGHLKQPHEQPQEVFKKYFNPHSQFLFSCLFFINSKL